MEERRRFDVWEAGGAYERYMGRWSRGVAREFVDWLGCPGGLRWLDVGCGTGVLASVVGERCRPRVVVGERIKQVRCELDFAERYLGNSGPSGA
ncbi:hypothetical protein [Streptomyces fulvoviolaceus]|uniref:hypothetical protein n=1 Tax=Streptomyces fulvoviolaceus TaxID=285535 RepID=UPI0005B7FE8D